LKEEENLQDIFTPSLLCVVATFCAEDTVDVLPSSPAATDRNDNAQERRKWQT
jgi:hypothetical protein